MKKNILRIFIILVIFAAVIYNTFFSTDYSPVQSVAVDSDLTEGDDYLLLLENADLQNVEKAINEKVAVIRAQEEELRLEEERIQSYENLKSRLEKGEVTLRQLFSDVYFVGDSLMHGLNSYAVLDSANMTTMVSASLYHLQDNLGKIIANNPSELVLHYGINMLVDSEASLNSFISLYESLLLRLKENLPDTKIYVSGIFNVAQRVSRQYPGIEKYNLALSELCEKIGVFYVDNSPILPGDESYYGGDGIHLSKSFYSDVWLPHLYYSMKLS